MLIKNIGKYVGDFASFFKEVKERREIILLLKGSHTDRVNSY